MDHRENETSVPPSLPLPLLKPFLTFLSYFSLQILHSSKGMIFNYLKITFKHAEIGHTSKDSKIFLWVLIPHSVTYLHYLVLVLNSHFFLISSCILLSVNVAERQDLRLESRATEAHNKILPNSKRKTLFCPLESNNSRTVAKPFCEQKPTVKFFLTPIKSGFYPQSKYFRIIAKLHFANFLIIDVLPDALQV